MTGSKSHIPNLCKWPFATCIMLSKSSSRNEQASLVSSRVEIVKQSRFRKVSRWISNDLASRYRKREKCYVSSIVSSRAKSKPARLVVSPRVSFSSASSWIMIYHSRPNQRSAAKLPSVLTSDLLTSPSSRMVKRSITLAFFVNHCNGSPFSNGEPPRNNPVRRTGESPISKSQSNTRSSKTNVETSFKNYPRD